MTNKTQPNITLVNGGEYLTRKGTTVKMSVDRNCGDNPKYNHQFLGSNGFYYRTDGSVFFDQEFKLDVISEVPKIALEHGKTYVTASGKRVTLSNHPHPDDFYKFKGSNQYNYGENGTGAVQDYGGFNIVSEDTRLVSTSSSFTTSELQSLIQMQSKIITSIEAEILELKETAAYLGCNSNSRVQELCKKIYNEITSKNKRLSKLVKLQTKLKRTK